jgi:4'-phosphopantetheinyl transferase
MIRWLIQTVVSHPDLTAGRPPAGLLTPAESAHFATLLAPHRRRDWLVGRWTAKLLTQKQIAATHGFCLALGSFAIRYDMDGAPCVTGNNAALHSISLALSISHSHGYALCAIAETQRGEVRLGVDIELVDAETAPMLAEFFTPAEEANLNAAPAHLRITLATATWSIKEAIRKAMPTPLRINPCDIESLVRPPSITHWTPLLAKVSPGLRAHAPVGPLRAWWRVQPNVLRPGTHFVMTLAAFGVDL